MTAAARPLAVAPDLSDASERVGAARAWLGEFFGDLDAGSIRLAEQGPGGWTEYAHGVRHGVGDLLDATRDAMLDGLAAALVREADTGRDMFACPYAHEGPRRKGEAVARRHAHADIDGPLDLDKVRDFGGMAVASGSTTPRGGPHGHVYVRLSCSVPSEVHSALCAAVGQYVGGEHHDATKTGDADVLRPAGTLNHKRGQVSAVRWLVAPDDSSVTTWEPETLAGHLGLDWPVKPPEPSDTEQVREAAPSAGGLADRLDGLARSVTDAPTGTGNARLNWAAGVAGALCTRHDDAPAAEEVHADLVAAYLARPVPMRESATAREREARRTVASGWRWGTRHPDEADRTREEDRPLPTGDDDEDDKDEMTTATDETAAALHHADEATFVDLASELAGGTIPPPPAPEYLHRADGRCLLYPRAINRLFGDTESGKSWCMLAAVVEELLNGGRAAVVDADAMGWRRVVRRLLLLGVPVDVLADPERFRMVVPGDGAHLLRAFDLVAEWSPEVVGLDAFGGLLALLRKSRNDPDDVAEAMLTLRVLADSGACVVLLDHLAQSSESRKFGPSGTLEKGREVRGISLRVERVRSYGPGKGGASRLLVEKDTDGGVREHLAEVKGRSEPVAGVFRLLPRGDDPQAAGSLSWDVDAPSDHEASAVTVTDERADREAGEKISRALEKCGTWLSQTKTVERAKVNRPRAGAVLPLLEHNGYADFRTGKRGAHEYRSRVPFRDDPEHVLNRPEDEDEEAPSE